MDLLDFGHVELIFFCRQWVLVFNICILVLARSVIPKAESGNVEAFTCYDCHVLRSKHIIICCQVSRLISRLILAAICLYLVHFS